MIKYARGGSSIPHERVFKLDNDNLVGKCVELLLEFKPPYLVYITALSRVIINLM